MGKSQTESSGSSSASERGPTIIKVKNCNNCGAEYARKGTLCGSCRGIRHRLLKKVRENKILAAVNNNLGATGNSPPHRNNNSNTVANNNSKQAQGDDAFLELPPIQIPVPGRSTTPPFPCLPSPSVSVSGRDRLVNSVASCSSCDSNLPLECRMCFCLQLQVRRLQTEKLELQRQLAEMEIEIHAMKLQKMNGDRLQSFTETRILPSPSPSPTPSTLPSFDRDLFTLSQTSIHQLSSSHFSESTPLHGGVSVCQLVS